MPTVACNLFLSIVKLYECAFQVRKGTPADIFLVGMHTNISCSSSNSIAKLYATGSSCQEAPADASLYWSKVYFPKGAFLRTECWATCFLYHLVGTATAAVRICLQCGAGAHLHPQQHCRRAQPVRGNGLGLPERRPMPGAWSAHPYGVPLQTCYPVGRLAGIPYSLLRSS